MFEPNPAIQRLDTDRAHGTITFDGVIHRTGFLLVLTGLAYYLTWQGIQAGELTVGAGIFGSIVGLVLALIVIFTKSSNPILISCYAAAEGVALGSLSYLAEMRYPGIAAQATTGTIGCFLSVLLLYRLRILKASPVFAKILVSAMLGITLLYVGDFVSGLFGHPFSVVHGNTPLSIGVSVVIVLVAALSFVIDFAQIEEAVQSGADARYAWRCSFGLIVGLVWLYMEILRLLMKSRSRN